VICSSAISCTLVLKQ